MLTLCWLGNYESRKLRFYMSSVPLVPQYQEKSSVVGVRHSVWCREDDE